MSNIGFYNNYPSSFRDTSTVASSARLTAHEQRANGSAAPPPPPATHHHHDTYRNNLHHTFKKMSNPLLDKKLETTEL